MRAKLTLLLLVLLVLAPARSSAQEQFDATQQQASNLTKQDIPELVRKAEAGDAKAQLLLGDAYAYGYGTRQKHAEAVKWYQKSAEQGNPVAQYSLCNLYQFGHAVRKDQAEAIKWCRRAGEQGLAEAQTKLGILYKNQENYAEAEAWTRKAAEQGHFGAQINLSGLYAAGQGVPQDHLGAYIWILLARAARCGSPPVICIERNPEGDAFTQRIRDKLAAELSPEQIDEAKRRASEWLIAHQREPLPAEETEAKTVSFLVAHEHGGAMVIPGGSHGLDYCFGWMTISKGTIRYADRRGHDAFEIPVAQIKQVKAVIRAMGGAHGIEIRMGNDKKHSFYPINDQVEPQDAHRLLDALNSAVGRN